MVIELRYYDERYCIVHLTGTIHDFIGDTRRMSQYLTTMHYQKKLNANLISIFDYKLLVKYCKHNNIALNVERKVHKLQKQLFKVKNKSLDQYEKEVDIKYFKETTKLYDHQPPCINMIWDKKKVMLGDDMGLGKTIQTIGVIGLSMQNGGSKYLIVVPSQLLTQWVGEFHKFTNFSHHALYIFSRNTCITGDVEEFKPRNPTCNSCDLYNHCDLRRKRHRTVADLRSYQLNKFLQDGQRIMIVTYEMVRSYEKEFAKIQWDGMFFDEASKIKSRTSKVSKCLHNLSQSAGGSTIVLPMSGTLVENSVTDLYSISQTIFENMFGPHFCFQNKFLVTDYFERVVGHRNAEMIKERIDGFYIRRTIDEAWKDKPHFSSVIRSCTMTPDQAKMYKDISNDIKLQLQDEMLAKKISMSSVAVKIMRLLCVTGTLKSIEPESKSKNHSGKILELIEILKNQISVDHKVVIFTRFANKVAPFIFEELNKHEETRCIFAHKNPRDEVKSFINNNKRVLLCTDKLAYGTNMQFARYLINYDLWWNPARIDQRIARVYRMGQQHPVQVINLITEGTFEDYLYEIYMSKSEMFAELFSVASHKKSISNRSFIKNLIDKI